LEEVLGLRDNQRNGSIFPQTKLNGDDHDLGAILVQFRRDIVKWQGLSIKTVKNCLEMSSKWRKVRDYSAGV